MISRRTIYDSFIKYFEDTIVKLTSDKDFYEGRFKISSTQLEINKDILSRHSNQFEVIYSMPADTLLLGTASKIDVTNKRSINKNLYKLVAALCEIDNSYGEHTVLFIDGIIDNYFNVINEIKDITRKLQLLTDKLDFFNRYKSLSKNVVYYILSQNNKYLEKSILNGETIHLGNHMGMVKVVPKKVNGKPNWQESFKYRDKLIEEGKVPYNEAECLKAKAESRPYHGIKWFVMYENEIQHYINWYAYSRQLPNKNAYSFQPARYNKSDMLLSEIKTVANNVNDLFNYRIGIVNKLNLALDINELQFIKYINYDI